MPISPEDALRQRVNELRIKAGLSEYQLSLALGLSKGYIQQISSGKSLPSMRHFFDICEYFKMSPAEFFDIENRDPQLTRELVSVTHNLNEVHMKLLIDIAKNFQPQHTGRSGPATGSDS
jgi:transcriptional regulator with XRE-family HTH domain